MKERPILFSGPMVRAILDGTKTQTRRVLTRLTGFPHVHDFEALATDYRWDWRFRGRGEAHIELFHKGLLERCPYGVIGDRLWVRETCWVNRLTRKFAWYVHQDVVQVDPERDEVKKRPAIHMLRADARILLEITDVRVQRLHEISEDDARAEGCWRGDEDEYIGVNVHDSATGKTEPATAIEMFQFLWASINGADSWNANPFVWCLSFRKVE